jgi:hypothetical protein
MNLFHLSTSALPGSKTHTPVSHGCGWCEELLKTKFTMTHVCEDLFELPISLAVRVPKWIQDKKDG